jgi:hypothetical protein
LWLIETDVFQNPQLHKHFYVSANAMKHQATKEIIKFLKDNIQPYPDEGYGQGYRASAYLTDGTFIPCVMFRNPATLVNLAIRRFNEEQSGKSILGKSRVQAYRQIVKAFVAAGNRINYYDVAEVERSINALPLHILQQIKGETTMSWTGFVLRMKDNKCFGFGTRFLNAFFQMPENYSPDEVVEVINHSYVSKTGQVCSHKVPFFDWPTNYDNDVVHHERAYFDCFIDNL